ncbi:triple tyrosine motif-containing protein [Sphingobacterium corticis]|uniref:Triple tyrosine motif-containing protein n=1 Tax=Sphingobacterium corticis TaxID=1812823 RepID=A0ABW5NJU1_9SPHI
MIGTPLIYGYPKSMYQGGSRTWQITQDSSGVMLFANNEGLIAFDGQYWTRHQLPNQTIVRSVCVDEEGRVFVGGQGIFGFFDKDDDGQRRFHSLSDKLSAKYPAFADVWNTVVHNHRIIFRSHNAIFVYDKGRIVIHPAVSRWEFLAVVDGRLFAQDAKLGLIEFRSGKKVQISGSNVLQDELISAILPQKNNQLLIVTTTDKRFSVKNGRLEKMSFRDANFHDLYVPSVARIDNNTYVYGTALEGCLIRDAQGNPLQTIGMSEGLANNNVSSVFVDRQQNIWAGVDNGLALISYGSAVRYMRPSAHADVTGYSTLIKNDDLYIASSNGVFHTKIPAGQTDHSRIRDRFQLIGGSAGGESWKLKALDEQIWLAHNRGIYKIFQNRISEISKGQGVWTFIQQRNQGKPQTKKESILAGGYHGIQRIEQASRQKFSINTLAGQSDSYRFLVQDEFSTIWASHPYRGIYQLKMDKESREYQAHLFTETDGLPSTYQNYVFQWGKGVVFGTKNGIFKFNSANERFEAIKELSAFNGVGLRFIQRNEDGNIWFASDRHIGLARSNGHQGGYQLCYLNEIDGMHTTGFENIYAYDKNNVYIGAEKGVVHVNWEKYVAQRDKPSVLLSKVIIKDKNDSILYNKQLLDANFDSFHFEFTSPSYGANADLSFSYKLDGYDKRWSDWSTDRQKAYTNLPSGKYQFQIKAKNNLHFESDILNYSFEVKPPWYATTFAWAMYTILFLFGFYILVKWQRAMWLNRQKKHDAEIARLRYIYQLELEKNEREIIKLQKEHLEDEVLEKTKELANTSLQLMENADALTKLRNELNKIESGQLDETELRRVTSMLKDVEKNAAHWDQFAVHFDELNDGFLQRLSALHPNLSRNDLKVCAYLRLHLSTKQIAQLQSISVRGVEVHRYRIRKKLQVETEVSLSTYLNKL